MGMDSPDGINDPPRSAAAAEEEGGGSDHEELETDDDGSLVVMCHGDSTMDDMNYGEEEQRQV